MDPLKLGMVLAFSFGLGCFAPKMKRIFDCYTVPGPLKAYGYLPRDVIETRQLDYVNRKRQAYKRAWGCDMPYSSFSQ